MMKSQRDTQLLNHKENEISNMKEKIRYLTEELANIRHKYKKSQQQKAEMQQYLENSRRIQFENQNKIKQLENSNAYLVEVGRSQKLRILNLIEQQHLNKQQISNLTNALSELELQYFSKEKQVNILNFRNEEVADERDHLRKQLDDVQTMKRNNQELMHKIQQLINSNQLVRYQKMDLIDEIHNLKERLIEATNKNVQFETKYRQREQSQERTIEEIKQIRDNIYSQFKDLQDYQKMLFNKSIQLNGVNSDKDTDQIKCLKNGLRFMTLQIRNKYESLKNIKQNYKKFQQTQQKNKQFQLQLKNHIIALNQKIQRITVQNLQLKKSSSNYATQEQIKQMKDIMVKLLWENQACHKLLFNQYGFEFKNLVNAQKKHIQKKFTTQHDQKQYGDIDNRYVTVKELINKNRELMSMISDKQI